MIQTLRALPYSLVTNETLNEVYLKKSEMEATATLENESETQQR